VTPGSVLPQGPPHQRHHVDIRRIFSREKFEKRGITYWGL
jgi:hypothetical protein